MTVSLSMKNMLIISSSSSDSSKEMEESSWLSYGIMLEGLISSGVESVTAFAYEDQACMQKDVYVQNPSSKRSSGRPDTGVGKVFLNCPKD